MWTEEEKRQLLNMLLSINVGVWALVGNMIGRMLS